MLLSCSTENFFLFFISLDGIKYCDFLVETKDEESAEAKIVRSLKRSCELWSMEDKNTFFKALNEFGKDFDGLQSYFLSQGKKRGLSENMIKNKEQIRHFYYRTWHKISKHLKFSEGNIIIIQFTSKVL